MLADAAARDRASLLLELGQAANLANMDRADRRRVVERLTEQSRRGL